MITVISGSNRSNNKTLHFAKFALEHLQEVSSEKVQLLDLSNVENSWVNKLMYKDTDQSETVRAIQETFFIPASKFWFFGCNSLAVCSNHYLSSAFESL